MKKYFITTYGCQMNWSDSERIAAVLEKIGYEQALNEKDADLIVINMCSVRQSAVNRVYGKIFNFAKLKTQSSKLKTTTQNSKPKTLLTGCILKKDLENFKDKVDYILPIKSLPVWKQFLNPEGVISQPYGARKEKHFYYPNQRDLEFNKKFGIKYFKIQLCRKNKFSAFVPISTGCDNFCSYCVVPYLRGPEISRPVEEIISEVKNLVKKGYKEIWLLGQNVNSYKSQIPARNASLRPPEALSARNASHSDADGHLLRAGLRSDAGGQNSKLLNFANLLKLINKIPGDFWIRFISPHPKDFSGELIKTMAKCEKVTPYLNLPVQSGDNKILKNMNRSYTIEQYKKLVKKIRKEFVKVRGKDTFFCLTTDIIVGFPGETKKQFENTIKLFKEIKFDMAYISQYSSRFGTATFGFKDDISQKEKKERDKILTEILKKTALENNKKYIGREIKVLFEKEKNGFLIGKSEQYKTVKCQMPRPHRYVSQPATDAVLLAGVAKRCGRANPKSQMPKLIGDFVKVKITEANSWGLKGDAS